LSEPTSFDLFGRLTEQDDARRGSLLLRHSCRFIFVHLQLPAANTVDHMVERRALRQPLLGPGSSMQVPLDFANQQSAQSPPNCRQGPATLS
jgi:hypothetical protein